MFEIENGALCALGDSLSVPSSFGSINVGETLRCCLSLSNSSATELNRVALRVELHVAAVQQLTTTATTVTSGTTPPATTAATTTMKKSVLIDTSERPLAMLSTGDRADYQVHHTVTEPGPHTIVCIATWAPPSSSIKQQQQQQQLQQQQSTMPGGMPQQQQQQQQEENPTLKRYFQFKVGKAIEMKPRVVEVMQGKWLVEVQVDIANNVFLESVMLENTPDVLVSHQVSGFGGGQVITGTNICKLEKSKVVKAGTSVKRVFEVNVRAGKQIPGRREMVLGQVAVVWRGNMGEQGKVVSGMLSVASLAPRSGGMNGESLQLRVIVIPKKNNKKKKNTTTITDGTHDGSSSSVAVVVASSVDEDESEDGNNKNNQVKLHEPFEVKCLFTNKTVAAMLLRVSFIELETLLNIQQQSQSQSQSQSSSQSASTTMQLMRGRTIASTEQTPGLALAGVTSSQLVELPQFNPHNVGGCEKSVSVTMLPLLPGLRKLCCVKAYDINSHREFVFNDLGSVLVLTGDGDGNDGDDGGL